MILWSQDLFTLTRELHLNLISQTLPKSCFGTPVSVSVSVWVWKCWLNINITMWMPFSLSSMNCFNCSSKFWVPSSNNVPDNLVGTLMVFWAQSETRDCFWSDRPALLASWILLFEYNALFTELLGVVSEVPRRDEIAIAARNRFIHQQSYSDSRAKVQFGGRWKSHERVQAECDSDSRENFVHRLSLINSSESWGCLFVSETFGKRRLTLNS